jgi:cobalt/nickel transport system permease protein
MHHFIDRYADLDSPLHQLEATSKLLSFTALIVCVLFIPAGKGYLFFIYFFLAAVLMGISQVPAAYIMKRMLVILPLIAIAGSAIPWIGFQGFWILFLRVILLFLLLILLVNTTRFFELLRSLRRLGCPRIFVEKLISLYHCIFVLAEEAIRMKQAYDCRRAGRSMFPAAFKVLHSMPRMLFWRSFERAKRFRSAMLSRGYMGDFPVFAPRKFTFRDLGFLGGTALFVVWTWYMR